jgi:hypothetical protein
MQRPLKKPFLKSSVLKTILIFLISYFVSLIIWVQVKDTYGYVITFVASKVVAGLKDARLEEISQEKGIIQATFSPLNDRAGILIDIPVKTSSYTFNAPLTLAIMAALYMFIKRRRRAYAEAALILLIVHFLYVFSLEAKQLTGVFMERGIEGSNILIAAVYQYLWGFMDNMVIRFEPFLIGFYMFIRFRDEESQNRSQNHVSRS